MMKVRRSWKSKSYNEITALKAASLLVVFLLNVLADLHQNLPSDREHRGECSQRVFIGFETLLHV